MIVPMKHFTLAALRQDEEAILVALQKLGCVEIIAPGALEEDAGAISELENRLGKLSGTVKFLQAHAAKKQGMLTPRPQTKLSELTSFELSEDARSAAEIESRLSALAAERAQVLGLVEQFAPWASMDERIENLHNTENAAVIAGFVPDKSADALSGYEGKAVILRYGLASSMRAVLAVCHSAELDALYEFLRSLQFADASFPKLTGYPKDIIAQNEAHIARIDAEINALNAKANELSERERPGFMKAHDKTQIERDRAAARAKLLYTDSAFILTGWTRYDTVESVEKAVAAVTSDYYAEFRAPLEDETPPSVVKNGKFAGPHEMVTDLFSRPNPRVLDPTPLMAPFYMMFFGMMVSDAGYGIILAIGSILFNKFMRPRGTMKKLVGVLVYGGISTFIWGALFGGWFGIDFSYIDPIRGAALLLNPMGESMLMLGLCFGLGLVHLIAGMCVKMYMDFKSGQAFSAIFDTGVWITLILGLILLAAPMLGLPAIIGTIGTVIAIASALALLLTQGRHQKNIFKKFTSGLLALYNVTGYLSDVLSYARLFALGLATGVIGQVMNTLAMMCANGVGWVFTIAIMIGGHLFNLVLNTLGAFVHAARLQYIEYFGKFYESGGKEFKPLAVKTKYLDVSA